MRKNTSQLDKINYIVTIKTCFVLLSYNVVYQDIGIRDYKETWDFQGEIFKKLIDNKINNYRNSINDPFSDHGTLIFVEHPHVYTLGRNGSENNLLIDYIQLRAKDAKFYKIDRGGDITYHGPGQIVGYPVFDLEKLKIGLKEYISRMEEAILLTLSQFGISGSRLDGATGAWIGPDEKGMVRKVCAIGVKSSRYVTMHGFAFNVNTDLSYFSYINPCGFTDKGVTSLEKELGIKQDFDDVKLKVKDNFKKVFDLRWVN
jgi:lipoyl(octanoyl) transferase